MASVTIAGKGKRIATDTGGGIHPSLTLAPGTGVTITMTGSTATIAASGVATLIGLMPSDVTTSTSVGSGGVSTGASVALGLGVWLVTVDVTVIGTSTESPRVALVGDGTLALGSGSGGSGIIKWFQSFNNNSIEQDQTTGLGDWTNWTTGKQNPRPIRGRGIVRVATAGTLTLQLGAETGGANVTAYADGLLRAEYLGA